MHLRLILEHFEFLHPPSRCLRDMSCCLLRSSFLTPFVTLADWFEPPHLWLQDVLASTPSWRPSSIPSFTIFETKVFDLPWVMLYDRDLVLLLNYFSEIDSHMIVAPSSCYYSYHPFYSTCQKGVASYDHMRSDYDITSSLHTYLCLWLKTVFQIWSDHLTLSK